MSAQENARDIAVVLSRLSSIDEVLTEIRTDNQRRAAKQSEDHRLVMGRIETLDLTLAKHQGFVSGFSFAGKAFWVTLGVGVSGVWAAIKSGHIPLK